MQPGRQVAWDYRVLIPGGNDHFSAIVAGQRNDLDRGATLNSALTIRRDGSHEP